MDYPRCDLFAGVVTTWRLGAYLLAQSLEINKAIERYLQVASIYASDGHSLTSDEKVFLTRDAKILSPAGYTSSKAIKASSSARAFSQPSTKAP